jgi:hypothetical protein
MAGITPEILGICKSSLGLFIERPIAWLRSPNMMRRVGRDSRDGQFIPIEETKRRPDTTEVERIKYPVKK